MSTKSTITSEMTELEVVAVLANLRAADAAQPGTSKLAAVGEFAVVPAIVAKDAAVVVGKSIVSAGFRLRCRIVAARVAHQEAVKEGMIVIAGRKVLKALTEAIQAEHPDWTPEQVTQAIAELQAAQSVTS